MTTRAQIRRAVVAFSPRRGGALHGRHTLSCGHIIPATGTLNRNATERICPACTTGASARIVGEPLKRAGDRWPARA